MSARADAGGDGFTRDELLAIEQAAVNAWPATETRNIDGWLWRYSGGGGSQRANSVSPLAFHGADVEAAIAEVEALYFDRHAPCRFQVGTELAAPADLDRILEGHGYRIHEPVTTLAMRLSDRGTAPAGAVIAEQPDEGWMEVYLANVAPDRHAAAPGILASVPSPRAFLSIKAGGQVISTALAFVHGTVVIAECIGTRADARRTGAASKVMAALEAWGWQQGARIAALQAVTENHPAQRLYAALGYTKVNGYHYRIRERRGGSMSANRDLYHVDWSAIPAPQDDGAARHLEGMALPDIALPATDGSSVSLASLPGLTVVYAYPRTGRPGEASLVDDWDMIPGARGCTPQSCAFRDHHAELKAAGASQVFGLSTQGTEYQREMVERVHLPFPVLSDENLALARAMRLPTMEVAARTLLKRLAMVIENGRVVRVFYPVFPPDRNAADVLSWLHGRRGGRP